MRDIYYPDNSPKIVGRGRFKINVDEKPLGIGSKLGESVISAYLPLLCSMKNSYYPDNSSKLEGWVQCKLDVDKEKSPSNLVVN
jgi:hypothetical protein